MKEEIIKLLGLNPEASDKQIVDAIVALADKNQQLAEEVKLLEELIAEKPETDVQKLEKRIAQKISQSGGALNREQALTAIRHQDEHGEKTKPAKKK